MNPDTPQSPNPTSSVSAKTKFRRYDMKKLLADPELRRKLIVQSTIATQAREGIDVSEADAEDSYYVVTQAERSAFFGLLSFATSPGENDGRHVEFVKAIGNSKTESRFDITLRQFQAIDGSPIAYDKLAIIGHIFQDNNKLDPFYAQAVVGLQTSDDSQYVRLNWEIPDSEKSRWRQFAKGGSFCRFYSDVSMRVLWTKESISRMEEIGRVQNRDFYFRQGLSWQQRNQRGFSMRRLPAGCIFAHISSVAIPKDESNTDFLLGVMNSNIAEFMLRCFSSFGAWEVGAVKRVPIPTNGGKLAAELSALASHLHDVKFAWDTGNEICTRFSRPWILQPECAAGTTVLSAALEQTLRHETFLDAQLNDTYARVNDEVYRLYGVNSELRAKIEAAIGERPPELVWPQMEGKDTDQKRREHVDRLLTYLVKQILTEDEDHLVCLQRVAHEPPLLDRFREKLAACFPEQDPSSLETEVVNELKKKTKGYHRAESLAEWLHDVFFETHNTLYQQRPLLWHLASSQTRTEPGFACIVHAHHFDADALAKLRSVYIRDRIAVLKREAAQAGNDGKADLRLDLLALAEEVEAYDAKLALLQEGAHAGPEGGERDYRILTPWKTPETRPQGWHPAVDDGIKVNLAPLARTKLLRINLKLGTTESDE